MNTGKDASWKRFKDFYFEYPELGLAVDLSRSDVTSEGIQKLRPDLKRAFQAMAKLEKGAVANPDEKRQVGHYWLRAPDLAPNAEIRDEITTTLANIKKFAAKVHSGKIQGAGGKFTRLLVIGIGGSALGPQFVATALGNPAKDKLAVSFFDNTDPDGMDRTLSVIGNDLGKTLAVVISKSGGTPETRNGMLVAKAAYEKAGLDFTKHAVAITGPGSKMDKYASDPAWLARFPMWEWIGGRTSETSVVGLLPALLQGIDIDKVIEGSRVSDEITRRSDFKTNPAAQLAVAWHCAVNGKGEKDMVILPYKDRLELFSKYLQQLIMESLGKEKDLDGKVVHQGIAVYGNKGSTDQHAYIQQLREGVPNFFATFIEVLNDTTTSKSMSGAVEVEPGTTCGDFLQGFFLGTRKALFENGRTSITLTIDNVSPFSVGMLIALYERAVGLYAAMVNINAYHQPGVEAGKAAAAGVLALQGKAVAHLKANRGKTFSSEALGTAIGAPDESETIFKLCERLAANGRIRRVKGKRAVENQYAA